MGSFYMESTQINYRRDEALKTVDQKLQELSETSAIDTDIAPVFKSTNTYAPGDLVYYRNKLYRFNVEHTGAWAAGDVSATDVTTEVSSLRSGLTTLDNEVNGDATVYPYADAITIEDAVPANLADCSVKIEPDQNLHGYDHPWVGGAGKNKLPMTVDSIKALNATGTWSGNAYTVNNVTFTILTDDANNVIGVVANGTANANVGFKLFQTDSASAFDGMVLNGCPNDGSLSKYRIAAAGYNSGAFVMDYNNLGSDVTLTLTEDNVDSFYVSITAFQGYNIQNVKFYPMIRLSTETDATFAPYTNICPITGHTDASVQRDGKNLAFKKISGYTISANGVIEALATYNIFVGRVKKGQTYTVTKSSDYEVYAFYTTEPFAGSTSYDGSRVALQEEADYYTIIAPIDGYIAFRTNVNFNNGQLELGSTATPYVPYAGNTYTIALGDTIYGGTVDFDSGVMTVTHRIKGFTANDSQTWYMFDNTHIFYTSFNPLDGKTPDVTGALGSAYSNMYANVHKRPELLSNGEFIFNSYKISSSNNSIALRDDRYSTVQDFKSGLASPLQVIYELATPTTIQLTPQQIQLLKGTNTLTAYTGQISVTANGVSGAIGSVQEQANATDESLAELAADIAEQLPTAPTTDGAYVLTVTVADGTPTYSWESAT